MIRALLVLVLFVAVTVLVLSDIHPTTTKAATGSTSGPTTTTTTPTETRSEPSDHDHHHHPSEQGAGAGGQCRGGHRGRRRRQRRSCRPGGWALLPPTNASAQVTASQVYYLAGFKAAGRRHRLATAAPGHRRWLPYTTAAPISSIGTAEVAVVVGPDLADKTTRPPPLRPPPVDRRPSGCRVGPTGRLPSPEVRRALAPLLADPANSAIVSDFDGTLSPDRRRSRRGPARSTGTADLLARLARRFGVVAVVSGRPVSFLVEQLAPRRPSPMDHGIEWARPTASDSSACTASSGRAGRDHHRPAGGRAVALGRRRRGRSAALRTPLPASWSSPRAWPSPSTGAELPRPRRGRPGRRHPKRPAPDSGPTRAGCRSSSGPAVDIDKGSVTRALVEECSAAVLPGRRPR